MFVIIDNYDSFTYIIAQYLMTAGAEIEVHKNDAIDVREIIKLKPSGIILSPGPGHPQESGNSFDILSEMKGKVPILGICLGCQIIACDAGAKIRQAKNIAHGKESLITHHGRGIFQGVRQNIKVGRYHSLAIDAENLPSNIDIVARTTGADSEIMAIENTQAKLYGVQFHPESIMTEGGYRMIENFVSHCR